MLSDAVILNTYAVLLAFVAVVRLALGVVIVAVGLGRRESMTPDGRTAQENRGYLLLLLALVLVALNLFSWPLLYLLLQSYVPEWPGVMCIYGVTQIGKDSLGASRHLPGLLHLLQWTKPCLVFAGGAWFVLYLLNRRTASGSLLRRLFAVLLPLGTLAVVDATAELAYVAIPKREVFASAGCCTVDVNTSRFMPPVLVGDAGRPWLYAVYYTANIALILSLFAATRSAPGRRGLSLFLLAGVINGVVSGLFLVEVAAPALLHLPYHHCAYDLIERVPEAVVAIAFHVGALFCLGWACVAHWLGRSAETEPFVGGTVRLLLRVGLFLYLESLAMLSLELILA